MMVFDLGANTGEDTTAYLAQGYDVVSVEANPALALDLASRFAPDIAAGRVHIVDAAIAATAEPRPFYVSANHHWSSLDSVWAARDGRMTEPISVQCVRLADLFDRYGVPHYMKIDIEGADIIVLEQLLEDERRSKYVSVEDCRFGPSYLDILSACGYSGFKLSEQSQWAPGTSGPFGEDLPGLWLHFNDMKTLYRTMVRSETLRRIAPEGQYFDIHARLPC